MKRPTATHFAGALTAVLLAGPSARADFIQWKFNWTPTVSAITSDTSVDSFIQLTNEPEDNAAGSSDVVATNISVFSNAPRGNPDVFGPNSTNAFTLTMKLTDTASGEFANLVFGGRFTGTLSAQSADLDVTWTGQSNYVVELGNSEYTVDIGPYSPPGPPTADNKGSIAAHVEVRPLDVVKVPEPSTLVLSGIGMSLVGLASWRKRRHAAAA